MVDFKKMLEDQIAAMTPEQRARREVRLAREAAEAATDMTIDGHFERLGIRPATRCTVNERFIETEWVQPVRLRIRDRGDDVDAYETLSVLDAVTGYESFRIDEDFVRLLQDPEELAKRPRFYVCAGTPGRYDACWIDPAQVTAYLREMRPVLFEPEPVLSMN